MIFELAWLASALLELALLTAAKCCTASYGLNNAWLTHTHLYNDRTAATKRPSCARSLPCASRKSLGRLAETETTTRRARERLRRAAALQLNRRS